LTLVRGLKTNNGKKLLKTRWDPERGKSRDRIKKGASAEGLAPRELPKEKKKTGSWCTRDKQDVKRSGEGGNEEKIRRGGCTKGGGNAPLKETDGPFQTVMTTRGAKQGGYSGD